jgi:hypothetical protein
MIGVRGTRWQADVLDIFRVIIFLFFGSLFVAESNVLFWLPGVVVFIIAFPLDETVLPT